MANNTQTRAALANLPPAYGAPALTPLFNSGPPVLPPIPALRLPPPTAPPMIAPPLGPPDLPPIAPAPQLDPAIMAQYLALLGPPPTAPTPQSVSTLQRIAAALGGVSAGIQGQGPQYAAFLKAQQEQPQKEYEQKLAAYNQQRLGLGVQGLEAAQRKQERQQAQAQAEAKAQSDREFEVWKHKTGVTDDTAALYLRHAFDLEKIREQERINDERQAAQEKANKEKQRNDIVSKLVGQDFAPTKFANEIADAIVFGKSLSPAAEKWRSVKAQKLEAQLSRINAGGGEGKIVVDVVDQAGNKLGSMPYSQLKFTQYGELQGFPQGSKVQFPGQSQAPQTKGTGPTGIPLAFGVPGAPLPLRGSAPLPVQSQTPQATGTPALKIKRAEAKRKLVKNGYSSKEADAELNRLGIQ